MDDGSTARVVQDYLNDLNGDGDTTPCDTGTPGDIRLELPEWFDEEKYKRGQQFCRDNLFSVSLAQLCGLLAVGGVCEKLVRILHFTRNSSTPCTAYRRYGSTTLHTRTWYNAELAPGSESWKSIENIRKRHLYYSGLTNKHGIGFFTQKDMAETQFSLMSFVLARPKQIGLHDSNKRNLEAFVYFWRTIGYMFGVKDRFNVCRESLEETKAICITYLEDHIRKNFTLDYPEGIEMRSAFLGGMGTIDFLANTKQILYFAYELIGLKGYECFALHNSFKAVVIQDNKCQSHSCQFEKLSLALQLEQVFKSFLMNELFKFNAIKYFFNCILKLILFSIQYFPFIAIIKFGKKEAYVKV